MIWRILLLVMLALGTSAPLHAESHLFFLHNRWLELEPDEAHPQHGRAMYQEIVQAFEQAGLIVHSELRAPDTEVEPYSQKVVEEIKGLLADGVDPSDITVAGTSKGGFIARRVSAQLANPDINFVFIACFVPPDTEPIRKLDLQGNVLSIFESSDGWAQSAIPYLEAQEQKVTRFNELQLHTQLGHGFLFRALPEWIVPTIAWAKGHYDQPNYVSSLNQILEKDSSFNGCILVQREGQAAYARCQGFSHLESGEPLTMAEQFVIGSISKQITAVLVMQAVERGEIALGDRVSRFLPDLGQDWKDEVSIHHLLTHTHGIERIDEGLSFKPGSSFAYSQIGFHLLAKVLEQASGRSFQELSAELFKTHALNKTCHPDEAPLSYANLVDGYEEDDTGQLQIAKESLRNFAAAGSFISSAFDLARWNDLLHEGNLVSEASLAQMKKAHARRQHPIFGEIEYGYGLTFLKGEQDTQIGALGYSPGFVSASFYNPESHTSVIVLQNVVQGLPDFKKVFKTALASMEVIR